MWQRLTLNQPIVGEQVDFIKKVKLHCLRLRRRGAPDEILNLENRLVARYHFIDTRYLRVDFGWGLRFVIPYYSPDLVLGGGGAASNVFEWPAIHNLWCKRFRSPFHQNSSRFKLWPYGD